MTTKINSRTSAIPIDSTVSTIQSQNNKLLSSHQRNDSTSMNIANSSELMIDGPDSALKYLLQQPGVIGYCVINKQGMYSRLQYNIQRITIYK